MANNLWQKLAAIKAAVPYLQKNKPGFNFKYADPESVLGTINPLLLEHGVALKMEVTDENHERVKDSKGKEETLFNLRFLFTWINTEKPDEREEIRWAASGVNNDEQGVGSAMTYGLRYFMLNQFQIPTGKDDPDYLSQQRQGGKSPQKPPQKPKTAPQSTQRGPVDSWADETDAEQADKAAKADIEQNEHLISLLKTHMINYKDEWSDYLLASTKTREMKLSLIRVFIFELADSKQANMAKILKKYSYFKGKDGEKWLKSSAELEKASDNYLNTIYGKTKAAVYEKLAAMPEKGTAA